MVAGGVGKVLLARVVCRFAIKKPGFSEKARLLFAELIHYPNKRSFTS